MHFVTNCSKVAALACVLSAIACGGEDAERPVTTAASALENPIAACEAQLATCQGGPGAGGGCQEQMRSCLESYAEWVAAVREGLAQCRTEAWVCASSGGRENCRAGYDRCVDALWTNDPTGEDAGVADEDAGAAGRAGRGDGGRPGRAPRGGAGGSGGRGGFGFPAPGSNGGSPFPGRGEAGSSAGDAAGSGAPGVAGFPQQPGRPGQSGPGFGQAQSQPTPEKCMQELAQCMTSGQDLAQCAQDARQCLRTDPIGALFIH